MKFFSPVDYQHQLIVASLDDFTPNAALPHYRGGQFGDAPFLWRQAVMEFLCVNIKHGLIELYCPAYRRPYEDIETILRNGDDANNMDSEILWNALWFNGTEYLVSIMEKFNLRNWGSIFLKEGNEGFVNFLRITYNMK